LVLSVDAGSFSTQIPDVVARVLNDAPLRERIGLYSKNMIRGFSREEVADEFIALYAKLVSR
jgi:glycosyltransferase involved in cell wall biosynthesis